VASNYDITLQSIDSHFEDGDLKIGPDNGVPIIIKKDGTLIAENFKDKQDPIRLILKDGRLVAKIDGSPNSVVEYDIEDATFKHTASVQGQLVVKDSAFDAFEGFTVSNYKTSREKFTKGFTQLEKGFVATSTYARNEEFHFVNDVSGVLYSEPNIKTVKYFRPVNVPTKLVLDSNLSNVKDFLVVKTGEVRYAPDGVTPSGLNREGIVWVSPHEKFSFTGVVNQSIFVSGAKAAASSVYGSGMSGNFNVPVLTGLSRVTSKNIFIQSGHTLTGGMVCQKWSSENSGSLVSFTGHGNLSDSLFYQTVSGRYTGVAWNKFKSGVYTGGTWNGVIPSGIPVKIEYYSSSQDMGGDFNIFQVPTGGVNFSAKITATASGTGVSYDDAMRDGYVKLERKIKNKFNYAMQQSGWKTENSKYNKFKKMINVSSTAGNLELTGLSQPS